MPNLLKLILSKQFLILLAIIGIIAILGFGLKPASFTAVPSHKFTFTEGTGTCKICSTPNSGMAECGVGTMCGKAGERISYGYLDFSGNSAIIRFYPYLYFKGSGSAEGYVDIKNQNSGSWVRVYSVSKSGTNHAKYWYNFGTYAPEKSGIESFTDCPSDYDNLHFYCITDGQCEFVGTRTTHNYPTYNCAAFDFIADSKYIKNGKIEFKIYTKASGTGTYIYLNAAGVTAGAPPPSELIPECTVEGEKKDYYCYASTYLGYKECKNGKWVLTTMNCPSGKVCENGQCITPPTPIEEEQIPTIPSEEDQIPTIPSTEKLNFFERIINFIQNIFNKIFGWLKLN